MIKRLYVLFKLCWIFALFTAMMAPSAAATKVNQPDFVDLAKLIANPLTYANKVVTTFGYICLGGADPGLYLTAIDCNVPRPDIGVGLRLKPAVVDLISVRKEQYGDETYGSVTGRMWAAKPNVVVTDTEFQSAAIYVSKVADIKGGAFNSIPTRQVTGVVKPNAATAKRIAGFLKEWISAVKDQSDIGIVGGFLGKTAGNHGRAQLKADVHNATGRLSWILFRAPNSIKHEFAASKSAALDVDVFRSARRDFTGNSEFVACTCPAGVRCPSFPVTLTWFLRNGRRLCLVVSMVDNSVPALDWIDFMY